MSHRIVEVYSRADYVSLDDIKAAIEANKDKIDKAAVIVHDKDEYTSEDEAKDPNHKAGTLKPPHIHAYIRFKQGKEQQFSSVAKMFNVPEYCVSKSTSTETVASRKFDSMLLYLVHYNAPTKFQYSFDEVYATFNYVTYIKGVIEERKNMGILEKINQGIITRRNLFKHIDIITYSKLKSRIESAFVYYENATRSNSRDMNVIYVTGPSGCGKTTICKMIAKEKGYEDYDIHISGGSKDPFDSYAMNPVVILDDFRDDLFSFSECLKLLDNNTNSRIGSRYNDKDLWNCKWLFITSTVPLDELYRYSRGNESMTQLYRRIKTMMVVEKDIIRIYRYNAKTGKYDLKQTKENPIKDLIKATEIDSDMSDEELDDFLSFPPKK